MENQIIKVDKTREEFHTLEEMIAGCDSAVVTYGLDKDYNIHKVVTLFCRTSYSIHEFEDHGGAHNKILANNPNMALVKNWDYTINGKKAKRCLRDYYKVLFRTLCGFIKDKRTRDLRHIYEK